MVAEKSAKYSANGNNERAGEERRISYRKLYESYNQFINFLRAEGINNPYKYENYPVYSRSNRLQERLLLSSLLHR